MLSKRYAKNTYGPKCQNTHGPKLWLLDTWAWAHGPGRMGRRRPAAGVAKAEMGQSKIEKMEVLRMSLPIVEVESLSGPQESIFSLFRAPQLNSCEKKNELY